LNDKDYRQQLLKAATALAAEEARQTPEDQLQRIVIQGLGLPDGTVLSDEQWDMVIKASAPQGAIATPPATPSHPHGALDGLPAPGGRSNG
jgi:hypothetical protein